MHLYKTPEQEPRKVELGKLTAGKWFEWNNKTYLVLGWDEEPALIDTYCYEDRKVVQFISTTIVTKFKAATLSIAKF